MIPQGRLSTVVVEGNLLTPEARSFYSTLNYERGPVAIEDTSEGMLYQDWAISWDGNTGNFIATPETTGIPEIVHNVADITSFTFTFDQNARATIAYVTSTSSYLWWFDTGINNTVTTDLGADAINPSIYLDDKRVTQNNVNDMLLWYTKAEVGGTYELFMLRQRDRFQTEYSMATGLAYQYIHNLGMSDELRIQIVLKPTVPNLPYV